MSKWDKEKANLEDLILVQKISYEEIGRQYGCSGTNIRKVAKLQGIELPQRRVVGENETFEGIKKEAKLCLSCKKEIPRRNIYCDNICQQQHKQKEWVKRWKNNEETGIVGDYGISNHLRTFLFKKYNSKCCKCGWGEINTHSGKIPLEIEHIDGNFENNEEDNLELLCPNCHSLTSTYKGANRGNGRKERSKYSNE